MIDPGTVAKAVESAIGTASNVIEYINDVKSASEDRKNLLEELESTHYLLYRIKDRASQSHWDDKLSETMKWLSVPKGPLEQFQRALEKLASKLKPVEGLKKAGKSFDVDISIRRLSMTFFKPSSVKNRSLSWLCNVTLSKVFQSAIH